MTLALLVEIALTVLLAATLVYCAVLERRLAALRKGQDGFRATVAELNTAITAAGASMRLLKTAATGAAATLEEQTSGARALIDELALLTASGERIAERIERGATASTLQPRNAAAMDRPVAPVLSQRMEALRPLAERGDALRVAGNMR
jgi:hypothetical protein